MFKWNVQNTESEGLQGKKDESNAQNLGPEKSGPLGRNFWVAFPRSEITNGALDAKS